MLKLKKENHNRIKIKKTAIESFARSFSAQKPLLKIRIVKICSVGGEGGGSQRDPEF